MKIVDMIKAMIITMLFIAGLFLLPFIITGVGAAFVFFLSYTVMREVRKEKARAKDRVKTERAKKEGRTRVELVVVK